jgi:hypothetical protein
MINIGDALRGFRCRLIVINHDCLAPCCCAALPLANDQLRLVIIISAQMQVSLNFYLFISFHHIFFLHILQPLLNMPQGHGKFIACSHENCKELKISHPRWPLTGEISIAPCMRTCEYCGV